MISFPGVEDTLPMDGILTVFAPTNAAFDVLSNEFLQTLMTQDTDFLSQLILFHMVPDVILRKALLPCDAEQNAVLMGNGESSLTLCEEDVPLYQKGNGNPDDSIPGIIEFDFEVCNGMVHFVDGVLFF
jgi:uncharacterized surface protein with fasciclin (FAS1) repeats